MSAIISLPSTTRSAPRISGNSRSGWALAIRQGNSHSLLRWNSGTVATLFPTTLAGFNHVFQARVDARLAVGALLSAGGPCYVTEVDFNSGAVLLNVVLGTEASLGGCAVEMTGGGATGGGALGVVFDKSTADKLVFHAFQRAALGAWTSSRFEFPVTRGFGQAYFSSGVRGPDGLAWIFFTRDSAATIGLIRLRAANGNGPELVDFNDAFIGSHQDGISPSGENLHVTSAVDARGRIYLLYQNWPHQNSTCPFRLLTSRHALTEVYPDKSVRLLAQPDWWTPHVNYPVPVLIAEQKGLRFALEYQNINDGSQYFGDCALGWRTGLVKSRFEATGSWPEGRVLAFSTDGWVFFRYAAKQIVELVGLGKLSAKPKGGSLE